MANIESIGNPCCGCGACKNICPRGAITMQPNDEGFLYPVIDKSKCIDCGLCARACPVIQESFKPDTDMPKCYAVKSSLDIMEHSSSGGMFSVLAEYVLNNSGYVCGAAFDKTWGVEHKIISEISGLYELQTSKYVQSDTKGVYSEIKKLLIAGHMVLFSGTPCQVNGLYSFLGCDYENLITVEVFCHGAPSPAVWQRYLQEISGDREITDINFRDKQGTAPSNYNFTVKTENDVITTHHAKNIYVLGFLRNLYLRKSCHHCPFAKMPRRADFSLGDFWEYDAIDKETDTQMGMSAVLLNTPRAEKIFSIVKPKLSFVRALELKDIIRGNDVLIQSVPEHQNRAAFFKEFQKDSAIIPMIKKHLEKRDVAILNFSSFSAYNFGAGLVGFALERAIKKLGYNPYTINFIYKPELAQYVKQNVFTEFQYDFLHLTDLCIDKVDLTSKINAQFNTVVVGSDQVFRNPASYNHIFYLDWVDKSKNIISYAASFGVGHLEESKETKSYTKKCLARFDSLSVREHSGCDIIKQQFGISDTSLVCDPTMLLTAVDYQPIIDKSAHFQIPASDYVAYYFLDANPQRLEALRKQGYMMINAYKDDDNNYRTFGDWLNIIKNAKYVITDSFHGSVFSIIFNKQFIVLQTKTRGNERIETLLNHIKASNFISDDTQLITEEDFANNKLDYKYINQQISLLRDTGYGFLRQALEKTPKPKQNITDDLYSTYFAFGFIPLLRVYHKQSKIYVKLFGILKLLKIKHNKIYLFGFIPIGKYQGTL